jgi:hypothetical protein
LYGLCRRTVLYVKKFDVAARLRGYLCNASAHRASTDDADSFKN